MVRLNSILNGILACQAAIVREKHQIQDDLNALISSETGVILDDLSASLLDPEVGDKVSVSEALKGASRVMDLKSATNLMQQKPLTEDVSNLVAKVQTGSFADFSEESLGKARRALNDLVEKAWVELDDKIFKCKGFQEMNRETYGQVNRDIMRLIEQINDLERIEAEAIEGISQKEQEIQDTEALLAKETRLYNVEYAENKAELTIRQNDLDVFQFILSFTKCADATSLSQTRAKVCELKSGRKTLLFEDRDTASKYKKML